MNSGQMLRAVLVCWLLAAAREAGAQAPCLIFVHGKQTNTDTFRSWTAARSYWVNGSHDFIRTATRGFQASYYVVGYNGTQPWWSAEAVGEVASEIVNAASGGADGGGNRCALRADQGGTFWVIAHSMGGTIMDFILGNDDPSDPNFNFSGPFSTAAQRISLVISLSGAHRGSQAADAVCGDSSLFCNFLAAFIQSCDSATFWLRGSGDVNVRSYSSPPARTVWLTGGYEAIFGASACLSGEDDGVVQYASIYACGGSPTTAYNNTNVCGNSSKQEVSGFRNLDAAHENHSDIRDDSDSDTRRAIPGGIWTCGGAPCAPNTIVQTSMTTARFVSILY